MALPEYLAALVGQRPTSEKLATELSKAEADLVAAPSRIAAADLTLTRIAGMSDREHVNAIEEAAAARRELARCEVRVTDARAALEEARKIEEVAALAKRRAAAQKRLESEYPKLLAKLDSEMAATARTAAAMREIEHEINGVNYAIECGRKDNLQTVPNPVATPGERYFTAPPIVTPDTTVVDKVWKAAGQDGRWVGVSVYGERDGKQVPLDPSARLFEVERIIRGGTRPGAQMPSPTVHLVLPPVRVGGPMHWPPS